ncbi:MAG: hypothetical protein BRD32_02230 [Bacteroidetes bacterium QH_2_64_74]|nr:MAG: hypothetical protein BRD32_02230 [Bacteroidetes bacterium QH_2_64_74]
MKRPIKRRFLHPFLATLLTATLLLVGCDSGKPDPIFRQTEILRVEVEPSPVPIGDTATFTCVIEDSTDEQFEFTWTIEGEGQTVTEGNTLQWIANVETGTYSGLVRADNGSEDSLSVSEDFTVEVVE